MLKMVPQSSEREYSVFVRADRKADLLLNDMIQRFDSQFLDGMSSYSPKMSNDRLYRIKAAVEAATGSTHHNIRFPDHEYEENPDVETFSDKVIHKNFNTSVSQKPSGVNKNKSDVLQHVHTTIEMGIHSQVLLAPGMSGHLYFEVTNTKTEATYHSIEVTDEQRFLQNLSPERIFLRPGETVTVTVIVLIPLTTPQGTKDRITFTSHGSSRASLSLNLKVITSLDAQDTTAPNLSWQFGGRCDNVRFDSAGCSDRYWSLDVTAQDWETGILRLNAGPPGLIYRTSYTVGSNDPIRATYFATCCSPKVTLTAYDIAGNQRSYNIDVRDIILTEASIAAIVLGALLIILFIILFIIITVWCCRRHRISHDLPTYRSHSTRSM